MSWVHPKIERIGRPALILLPKFKVDDNNFGCNGKTPDQMVRKFLSKNHGAFTLMGTTFHGEWKDHDGKLHSDVHIGYRVSFICPVKNDGGRDFSNLDLLIDFLSKLCANMMELCLYAEFGEEAVLIYP
ncbi:hypothetical protein COT97_00420 [Candidatus Falkowbacteria bacterium CG10_big_fil_rev_8_21_14_0_10_39_11]|uniref:Uncharacterized protein n=1 Tax=Candidatus Falkowbacteria bacterium CG10_big_fil_rev_8_21_14_0_10_39_11 TaxID=1974565 RepID=A0A2H0V6B3_9BACT|nr:MAG: hypothetical protein COT97_00420 [Candidatus Falkowbacteria bacterium CG10_big_fil_rev_8_21_14_0_10_39_11]